MAFGRELDFKVGNGLFSEIVGFFAVVDARLGRSWPLYNARSCQRCHLKDGRGHPPEGPDDNAISMFLRVSVPGGSHEMANQIEGYLASLPDPNYGTQLQDFSVCRAPGGI